MGRERVPDGIAMTPEDQPEPPDECEECDEEPEDWAEWFPPEDEDE